LTFSCTPKKVINDKVINIQGTKYRKINLIKTAMIMKRGRRGDKNRPSLQQKFCELSFSTSAHYSHVKYA